MIGNDSTLLKKGEKKIFFLIKLKIAIKKH